MKIFRYILVLLALTSAITATTNNRCEPINQSNPDLFAPWVCPEIDTEAYAELEDVDFSTGRYTCSYKFKANDTDLGSPCYYISTNYQQNIKIKRTALMTEIDNFVPAIDLSKLYIGLSDNSRYTDLSIPTSWNNKIDALTVDTQWVLDKLKAAATPLKEFRELLDISSIRGYSYDYLVKPYIPNSGSIPLRAQKGYSFSRFIVGLITLDSDVVKGYILSDGTLLFNNIWMTKRVSVTDVDFSGIVKNIFSQDQNNSNTPSIKESVTVLVGEKHNWIEIFNTHVWAFYYSLQRRLDIGYDIVSTQLLFFMLTFFAMTSSARGAARYISNRENGGSSGEIKINEANIMKTLGVLATIFVFFISIPSTMTSTIPSELQGGAYEMRTNASLVKKFIRYSVERGSYYGTMFADLGTDAFLNYIISKQELYKGNIERDNLKKYAQSMLSYYPALSVYSECARQYNLPASKFNSPPVLAGQSVNPKYTPTNPSGFGQYLLDNKIEHINIKLCSKALHQVLSIPEVFGKKLQYIKNNVENVKNIRIAATKELIENHVKLQQELGWINIITVPYTYFLMKNQELFFESSVDIKELEEKAKTFTENIDLKDAQDLYDKNIWMSKKSEVRRRIETDQHIASNNLRYTRYAFYDFVPGFSQIKDQLMHRLQALYSDILRLSQVGQRHNTQYGKLMDGYKKQLIRSLGFANRVYRTPSKQLYVNMMKKIKDIDKSPIALHEVLLFVSYTVGMAIWKSGFIIVFLSAISMVIGLKIVLYLIDVSIHFFVSPFVVLWAFASAEGGSAKIKNYMRDTLAYMVYPMLIVVGSFMFIFAYELFYTLYGFITNVVIESELKTVGTALMSNMPDVDTRTEAMSYLTLNSLREISELFIDLLSVYVAFVTIFKFPEMTLKMLGLGDSNVVSISAEAEKISGKGSGSVNPLSR